MLETLGTAISKEREKHGVSLRKFAKKLGISPAYLVDIEKDRRTPNAGLLQKIADAFDLPVSAFDQFSPDVPKPVKEWLQKNPFVERVLALLRKAPSPEDALARIERSLIKPQQRKYPIAIYESELQAISHESRSWDTETGGDLFGIWGDIPVIYLASRAGPLAIREHAHFRLDVDYLIKLSSLLERDWGLRYFGDWHSHHRLGLEQPSAGDRKRIVGLAAKNSFNEMAEFVVTFPSTRGNAATVEIHPIAYLDLPSETLTDVALIVLRGTSPVRSALIATSSLPEQQLLAFSSFPAKDISIPKEPLARVPGTEGGPVAAITERVLSKALAELTSVAFTDVELHREPFGFIVVAPVNDNQNIGFAFDEDWPHTLLQVDWIDRRTGRSEEIHIQTPAASLLVTEQLKEIFMEHTRHRSGAAE